MSFNWTELQGILFYIGNSESIIVAKHSSVKLAHGKEMAMRLALEAFEQMEWSDKLKNTASHKYVQYDV